MLFVFIEFNSAFVNNKPEWIEKVMTLVNRIFLTTKKCIGMFEPNEKENVSSIDNPVLIATIVSTSLDR